MKETNNFEEVKFDYDAERKIIEAWLEKYFEHIDVGFKATTAMVKNLETEQYKEFVNDEGDMEIERRIDTS